MHISKEFLMEAVGLSMLVALILISTQIFQRATKVTLMMKEEQERSITEMEEYEIVKYDGLQIDGMSAVSYIKKMTGYYELSVHVITSDGEFVVSDPSEYGELRDIKSDKYINPLAKFRCDVVRDENKAITELKIQIVKKGN